MEADDSLAGEALNPLEAAAPAPTLEDHNTSSLAPIFSCNCGSSLANAVSDSSSTDQSKTNNRLKQELFI